MYDFHLKAQAIRAGLHIELPFDSLILAASNSRITNVRIGTRKDLRNLITGFFRTLRSDWVMLGLLDPSTGGILTVCNSGEYLGISRDQNFSEEDLADLWLVLLEIFEHWMNVRPDFQQLRTDFINWAAHRQLEKNAVTGHC